VAVVPISGSVSAEDKRAIAHAWLERTAEAYPRLAREMLLEEGDRFRHPIGYALRERLPVLLDIVLGDAEPDGAVPPLDELIRIRAVQQFSASEAVSFIFLLKPVLRERFGCDARLEERIDALALMAFDSYMQCREKLLALRVNEARRRTFLTDRILARRTAGE
jgi:hypothetical protein